MAKSSLDTMWGPQTIAKLVITLITMVHDTQKTVHMYSWGVYNLITGAPTLYIDKMRDVYVNFPGLIRLDSPVV